MISKLKKTKTKKIRNHLKKKNSKLAFLKCSMPLFQMPIKILKTKKRHILIKMNYQAVSVLPIKLGKSKKNKKIKKNKLK